MVLKNIALKQVKEKRHRSKPMAPKSQNCFFTESLLSPCVRGRLTQHSSYLSS